MTGAGGAARRATHRPPITPDPRMRRMQMRIAPRVGRRGRSAVGSITRGCVVSAAALLLLHAPAGAQRRPDPRFAEVRSYIQEAMDEAGAPSVAVAVARDGEIIWAEGFGLADIARGIPATPNTMYSLASISKPMTATALMRLVERGEVELDRPANAYLGDGQIHSPTWDASGATVRRVLSHTAGLPLHWEFFYEGEDHPRRTTDEGIARFGVLVTPPGEVYQYSNLGYGIIERIVERVTGRSYAEVMETEVFAPLAMRNSTVGTGAGLEDRAAVRYDAELRPIPHYDFDHRGGSAVYSSVTDLVRFGMYHLGTPAEGQREILEDGTLRAMQRIATPGTGPREQGYGFGWLIQEDDNGYRRISHTGGMPGVSTGLYMYPEEGLAIAVVTNRSSRLVPQISHRIASSLLPGYGATSEARRAAAEAEPVRDELLGVPRDWLGEWTGEVVTPDGEVPLTLVFQPDGDVHVRLGDGGLVTLLNDPSLRDGRLVGRFAGTIPSDHIGRHPHIVQLDLRLRDGSLIGAANAIAGDGGYYFALSSYTELRRSAGTPRR